MPLVATKPRSGPTSCRPFGFTHSSSLFPCLWAFGPSALSCAGAAPPQRPALASHLVYSSPTPCLANSVYPTVSTPHMLSRAPAQRQPLLSPQRPCRGRPCACPGTPLTPPPLLAPHSCRGRPCARPYPQDNRPAVRARPSACPLPYRKQVNKSSRRRHTLQARRFPPQIWDAPSCHNGSVFGPTWWIS